jgi:hypothetical protein
MWRIGTVVLLALVIGVSLAPAPIVRAAAQRSDVAAAVPTGYNMLTEYSACPGVPADQECSPTSPSRIEMMVFVTDIACCTAPLGRIGPPVQVILSCAHYTTKAGVTTGQLGIANRYPYIPGQQLTPGSSAGILSPDTADSWHTDEASRSFISLHGTFQAGRISTRYAVQSAAVVDNPAFAGVQGSLSVRITGTLFDFVYANGKSTLTGYSQGSLSCTARPIEGLGQQWYARNIVYSVP